MSVAEIHFKMLSLRGLPFYSGPNILIISSLLTHKPVKKPYQTQIYILIIMKHTVYSMGIISKFGCLWSIITLQVFFYDVDIILLKE